MSISQHTDTIADCVIIFLDVGKGEVLLDLSYFQDTYN
jgi:hypothetical protein